MKRLITITAATVAIAAGAVGVGSAAVTAAPSAATAPAAAVSVNEAARIVTLERVYGSNYRIYKARYPTQLNWANNGCSVPFSVPITDFYNNLFEKSCDRHDFGYRNHGRSGYSRATVDARFRTNMEHQCVVHFDDPWDLPARGLCFVAADKFYDAVRLFGGGSW